MCQGLSYNLTSFPNIWLSIADQREAATLLRQYRVFSFHTQTMHELTATASFNNCLKPDIQPHALPFSLFGRPGADGAGVLRALAEVGVWDVSASVQPSGWRPPALPLSLLLR